jgi:energy-coupling factor transporter ATP-binding protein EcfA2
MSIREIKVRGYQSLYHVELALGDFTVVCGESDVGKSALYRALRAVFTSEEGGDFISVGEKRAQVILTLSTGDQIEWLKEQGKQSQYRMNETYWKRAKGIPDEVQKVLKLFPIVVDGEKFYPNLRGQFDNLFMLFDSSAKRARLLGSLISNFLLRGIKIANLERVRVEADIRAVSDLISGLEARESFDWSGLLLKIGVTKEMLRRISSHLELFQRLIALRSKVCQLSKIVSIKLSFLDSAWLEKTTKLGKAYEDLFSRSLRLTSLSEKVKQLGISLRLGKEELRVLDEKIIAIKKSLILVCPHCKGEIPLWEVLQ